MDTAIQEGVKVCSYCKKVKSFSDFVKDKSMPDGVSYTCKECKRRKYQENKEELQRKAVEAYWRDPERRREYSRQYHAAHQSELADYQRAYHAKNPGLSAKRYRKDPDNWKRRLKQYREADPKKLAERTRSWRERNPEKAKESCAQWIARHPEHRTMAAKRRRARLLNSPVVEPISRRFIVDRDGLICYLCGKTLLYSEVTLDHVVPLCRGGHHSHDNLKLACKRCNSRKSKKLLSELDWYQP